MNIEEIKINTFISNLSGIAKHFNEQEIKCDIKSNMIATLQLMDNSDTDVIIRFYRKDKSLFSYTEYKNNKRHGKAQTFYQDGELHSHTLIDRGKLITAKSFHPDGKLYEDKYYHKGKLHGKCKYYFKDETSEIRIYSYGTIRHKINFDSDGIKTREHFYRPNGYIAETFFYDKNGTKIKVKNWFGWW